jgi:carbon storage regulator
MLVLTRKKDQTIVMNDNIEITVLDIQGDQVRIGISAPRSVAIHRKEVFLEIQEENKKAAEAGNVPLDSIMKIARKDNG